ncbi:MAG: ABC transporter permease [Thermoplasmata archaeon]|jgi:peptide/nickel transport system permease protein|nr:ABC transporter permease [Thermoplasmatales archaeon]
MAERKGSLRSYILSRIILAIPMLLIIISFVFFIMRVAPGDPVAAMLGPHAPLAYKEKLREELGLTLPLYQQYLNYLAQVFTLNLGSSLTTGDSVATDIFVYYFPATLELTIFSTIVALGVGIPLGKIAAVKRDKKADVVIRLFGIIIYALPIYWFGFMLQLLFGYYLGIFPTGGRLSPGITPPPHITGLYTIDSLLTGNISTFLDALWHLALPSITLGLILSGVFIRTIRVNMLNTLQSDYVQAARARGVDEKEVINRHAYRNALVPVVTIMGMEIALLFAGAVLTETTYSFKGMGYLLVWSIQNRDYTMVQGAVIVYSIFIILFSVIIDIINAYIDPRIRY